MVQEQSDYIDGHLEVLFCVEGRNINPDELSSIFGVTPVQIIRRNDKRIRKSTGVVLGYYTESYWVFSSEHFISDSDINVHLEWILSNIRQHKNYLSSLQKDSARICIEIRYKSNSRLFSTSYLIDSKYLTEIAALGLDMGHVFISANN